jgi:hypothetical protein
MLELFPDWRTAARWGDLATLPRLWAAEDGIPQLPLPRYVLRWACLRCEQHFLGTDPAPQYCPRCDRPLAYVGEWDLVEEYSPRWWRDALDPGERP